MKILGCGVWGVIYDEKNKNQQNTLQNGGEHFMRYQKQKVMIYSTDGYQDPWNIVPQAMGLYTFIKR